MCVNQEEEFRRRHENMIAAQRREAQLVRDRIDDEKEKIRKIQKDAVFNFIKVRLIRILSFENDINMIKYC